MHRALPLSARDGLRSRTLLAAADGCGDGSCCGGGDDGSGGGGGGGGGAALRDGDGDGDDERVRATACGSGGAATEEAVCVLRALCGLVDEVGALSGALSGAWTASVRGMVDLLTLLRRPDGGPLFVVRFT